MIFIVTFILVYCVSIQNAIVLHEQFLDTASSLREILPTCFNTIPL